MLQAVVDCLCFWDINVGWPGKVYDARVLANSFLFRKGQSCALFFNMTERFAGVDVLLVIR